MNLFAKQQAIVAACRQTAVFSKTLQMRLSAEEPLRQFWEVSK
jgi:hypothetical protein